VTTPSTSRASGKTAEPLIGTIKRKLKQEIIDRSLVLKSAHDVYLRDLRVRGVGGVARVREDLAS
jgi:hypothetical protein